MKRAFLSSSIEGVKNKNMEKTKKQLIDESAELCQQIVELEKSETNAKIEMKNIQKQKDFWENAIEALDSPFFIIDANDYSVKAANSATYNGSLSKENTCYSLTHNRHSPCDGSKHVCPLMVVKKTKKPTRVNHLHYIKGKPINVSVRGYPILNDKGNVIQMIEHCVDITELKQLKDNVKEKEESYKELTESITDLFFAFDQDLRYTFWNRASEKLIGIKAKEAIGKTILDIFPDNEQTRKAIKVYKDVLKVKRPRTFFNEYQIKGENFIFEISVYPTQTGISVFAKDITQQKQVEMLLHASEAKYKTIVEAIPESVCMTDLNGVITFASKQTLKIHGYQSENEILGKSSLDFISTTDKTRAMMNLQKTFTQGIVKDVEYTLIRKDGTTFPGEMSAALIQDASGNPLNFIAITKDITERKKAEEAIFKTELELDAMYKNVPILLVLVDEERRVQKANMAALEFAKRIEKEIIGVRGGEALGCLYSLEDPRGCGFGLNCKVCGVRNTVLKTFKTDKAHYNVEAILPFKIDGKKKELNLLVNAVPINIEKKKMVLVSIYDISEQKEAEKALRKKTYELGERVKELNCLNKIVEIGSNEKIEIDQLLKETCRIITTGWQYPEITGCRIILDDKEFKTRKFKKTNWILKSPILLDTKKHGQIEISYLEKKPKCYEGPFLREERYLINSISHHLSTIIDRIRKREMLITEKNKFKTLLENLPQKIFLKDKEFVYQSCNINYAQDLNIKPSGITGKTDYDFFSKELADKYRKDDREILKSKLTRNIEEKYIEGEKETWVHTVKTPATNEKGDVIGLLGIFWDITKEKEAIDALKKNEAYLVSLLDSIHFGLLIIDSETHEIVDANKFALEMVGASKNEILGHICHKYICPTEKGHCPITDLNQTINVSERVLLKPDGNSIPILKHVVPVTRNGKQYLIESFIDITELKNAEEELKQSVKRISKTLDSTIQAMALALEAKDPYTAGHQRRVTQLALAIAEEMRLPEEKLASIRMAGQIHDIGKIEVPSEILSKPARLSETEFLLLKNHPRAGYNILKDVEFDGPIAEIILQHHERYDGSGYPDGLAGEKIHLEARIIGVADVVEAMASHRPYRPALGIDVALEEIKKNKGKLYDPEVADACMRILLEKGYKLVEAKH